MGKGAAAKLCKFILKTRVLRRRTRRTRRQEEELGGYDKELGGKEEEVGGCEEEEVGAEVLVGARVLVTNPGSCC